MPSTEARSTEYPIRVGPDRYTDGERCYVAAHPDLPGCVGYGSTVQEAKNKLRKAREAYFRSLQARGEEPPEPSDETSVEWFTDFGAGESHARRDTLLQKRGPEGAEVEFNEVDWSDLFESDQPEPNWHEVTGRASVA